MSRPIATLSIDLDDQWSYMKTAGMAGWDEYPSYLAIAVPRIREVLARRGVRLTVFVVGRDAAKPENRDLLAGLAADGHELANHSFDHESWLSRRPREVIAADIAAAEDAIAGVAGTQPRGFRAPSFGLSQNLLSVLAERGYTYDASTFPTFLGPLARAFYTMRSGRHSDPDSNRALLFGSLKDGLRPLDPYAWEIEGRRLLEMPVTTFPVLRAPIHYTYLVFLAGLSPRLAMAYLQSALIASRATGTAPSLVLHPLEFLDESEAPSLRFFPGMSVPVATKLALIDRSLERLGQRFQILTMEEHAGRLRHARLPSKQPRFEADQQMLRAAAA